MAASTAEFNRPSALAAQFLPPVAVLWPLLARSDSVLYLGAAFAIVVAVLSTLGLVTKLFRNKQGRGRLLRPALALLMSLLVLGYFTGERNLARLRVNGLAQSVQGQCQHFGRCPKTILGWDQSKERFASSLVEGDRPQHHYMYFYNGRDFALHLDLWGDFDEVAQGGAGQSLQPIGAWPWH